MNPDYYRLRYTGKFPHKIVHCNLLENACDVILLKTVQLLTCKGYLRFN